MMISRRSFFGFMAVAPAAAVAAPVAQKPDAYVPLPDGRSILVQGSMDNVTRAEVQSMLKAQQEEITKSLQANIGKMQARWASRYGA